MYYLDTSALIPLYVPEKMSAKVESFITQHTNISISVLTEVEFVSALSKKVRVKELSSTDANKVIDLFQSHQKQSYFSIYTLETDHYNFARDLITRFDLTLNTLDALHLAIAALEKVQFVTLDKNLSKTAKKINISTIDISASR